jgi:type I restriction enzyme R subunit
MATLDVRGEGEALRWDLLLGRAQYEAIALPGQPNPLRAEILAWLARLPAHLNPVRAKAEMLRRIRSDEFWTDADCASLEDMRLGLRDIIHLAERASQPPPLPPTVLDIKEEADEIQYAERPTKIKSVDYGIFRKAVEGALKPLFDTSPVLKKIRFGEQVSAAELLQLNSLVHTRHPDVDLATLREFFPDTALPLEQILRSIVGLDHAAVEARFAGFAGRYPLSSQQLRFLTLLKDHIRQYGAIATDTLFEAPFTSVHTEGLSGVFHDETQLSEIVALIRSFGEPPSPAAR